MPSLVVESAKLKCSFGDSSSDLTVTSNTDVSSEGKKAATVLDFMPNANIMPFGNCSSIANPQVASATAAAQGTLTPQPCVPVVVAPWAPGSSVVNICGAPALTDNSKCNCMWAGIIEITKAGQENTQVGG